jgi:hypothetical protein
MSGFLQFELVSLLLAAGRAGSLPALDLGITRKSYAVSRDLPEFIKTS